MLGRAVLGLILAMLIVPDATGGPSHVPHPGNEKPDFATQICGEISRRARQSGLPEDFLARLIWKESLFNPRAVSPMGAQGIAQFMPGTAKLRGLSDPFDPLMALAASAAYLAELRATFGNLGLAAAAYNAGEERARRFKEGKSGLPYETQDYVLFITGRGHEEWRMAGANFNTPAIGNSRDFSAECIALVLRHENPVEPQVERSASKSWGVVLSGGFSEARALQAFRRIRSRYSALLSNEEPLVVRKRNLSMGRKSMVRVMVGRDSRADADSLCDKLAGLGAACIVFKN